MKSFWFVCFKASFNDGNGSMSQVKGNSVHAWESPSFLPGTVKKKIEMSLIERLKTDGHVIHDFDIRIESFGEIDQEGFDDFGKKTLNFDRQELKLESSRFCRE